MMRDKIKGQVLMVQLQVLRYMFMKKDYEKAVEITNPIVNSRNKSHVWCPKCGSYNVSAIYVSNKIRNCDIIIVHLSCSYSWALYCLGK